MESVPSRVVRKMNDAPDQVLITAILESRDAGAVAELYDRHWSAAWKAALVITADAATAEDVAQDAFLAALDALESFDTGRLFRPWLVRIAVNRALNQRRSTKRLVRLTPGTDTRASRDTVLDDLVLDEALRELPEKYRVVVVLRYLVGYTSEEIAKVLHRPVGTVNSRLSRARQQLAHLLEETDERPGDPSHPGVDPHRGARGGPVRPGTRGGDGVGGG